MIKPSNTNENIIHLLGTTWPLSLKEIFNHLNKYNSSKISYQGVHKQVKQLLDENILKKNNLKYQLNIDWIKKEKDYFKYLENNYSNKKDFFLEVESTGFVNYSFNFSIDFAKILLDFLQKSQTSENKPIVFKQSWLYPPFSLSLKDYKRMNDIIKKNKIYIVSENETIMDKSFKKEYEHLGVKVKTKIKNYNPYDTIVSDKYIMFVYFPEGFLKGWEKSCKESKGSKPILFVKMLPLLYNYKKKFNITIIKNQENADSLRKETLQFFNKNN